MRTAKTALTLFSVWTGLLVAPASAFAQFVAPSFADVADITTSMNARQLIYSPSHHALIARNTASAIGLVDICSSAASTHFSNAAFTDMSASPDGRYVYAADYGGENIGYGTPAAPSYVHRLDLADGSWGVKTAYIAFQVQATSATTFVLKSKDQWVSFTYNDWGTTSTAVTQKSSFYPSVYFGDFRYDVRTARLIHGNSNLSSQEVQAFKIVNDNFVKQEGTGTYGSASNYGPNVTLATDGSVLYYGRLAVDALDVTHTLRVFPEVIYAATGDIAFGNGKYYDAHTGALLGALGFSATAYALNPNGADFWAYDATAGLFRHYVPVDADGGLPDNGAFDPCVGIQPDAGPADAGVSIDASLLPDASGGPDASNGDASLDASADLDATVDATVVLDATAGLDAGVTSDARTEVDATSVFDAGSASDAAFDPPFDGDAASDDGSSVPVGVADASGGCGCSLLGSDGGDQWAVGLSAFLLLACRRRSRKGSPRNTSAQ